MTFHWHHRIDNILIYMNYTFTSILNNIILFSWTKNVYLYAIEIIYHLIIRKFKVKILVTSLITTSNVFFKYYFDTDCGKRYILMFDQVVWHFLPIKTSSTFGKLYALGAHTKTLILQQCPFSGYRGEGILLRSLTAIRSIKSPLGLLAWPPEYNNRR